MSRRLKIPSPVPLGRVLSVLATIIVAGAIVAGIALVDSPEVERGQRLDKTRVIDLERIASAIDCYWTLNGELPASLAVLAAGMDQLSAKRPLPGICTPRSVVDPETGEPYIYRTVEGAEFELCAVFAQRYGDERRVRSDTSVSGRGRSWAHGAGPHCFRPTAFTLDSSRLPR